MKFFKIVDEIKSLCRHYYSVYKTDQVLTLYNKEKYQAVINKLSTFQQYKSVKINDFGFLFFVIGQENNVFLEQFLSKIKYTESALADSDNPNNLTPSTFAILNNLTQSYEVLRQHGAVIFAAGKDGNTVLHNACFYGKIDALRYCLDNGADINVQNNFGDTPLHLAIARQHLEIVKLLLDFTGNSTSNQKINLFLKGGNQLYPAQEAITIGNLEMVKIFEKNLDEIELLEQNQFSRMHLASQLEDPTVLTYFLENRIGLINSLDNSKQKATPLHYAANSRAVDCAALLLEKGAFVNAQDAFGNTAMHVAVLNRDQQMLRLLADHKANANLKNIDDLTPIDLCHTERFPQLLNFFRSRTEYIHLFRQKGDQNQ